MRRAALAAALAVSAGSPGAADPRPDPVTRCLSCHLTEDGAVDIAGLAALEALPPEWPLLFEDAFDLDDDGVAGRVRHVSGDGRPLIGRYGRELAAARFVDFAGIAATAHGIPIDGTDTLDRIHEAFEARSPDPVPTDPAALARFEARGCASCHVTEAFEHEGRIYRPLSDFLLHDLGHGPVRTAPLWGCPECLDAPGHE